MSGKGKAKQPRAAQLPERSKRPATGNVTIDAGKSPQTAPDRQDVMSRKPTWKFADLDHDGAWPMATLDGADLTQLLYKLRDFEGMTIRELFYKGDEPGKQYDVPSLPGHALKRLSELGRDDETKLARLRTGARERLYGFLRAEVFHVLWWDPTHAVYPSVKRHT